MWAPLVKTWLNRWHSRGQATIVIVLDSLNQEVKAQVGKLDKFLKRRYTLRQAPLPQKCAYKIVQALRHYGIWSDPKAPLKYLPSCYFLVEP